MDARSGRSFRQENLFGGSGVVWVRDLLEGRAAAPFSATLLCELEAGGEVGRHRQAADPELLIILSGEGAATIDDLPKALAPGVTLHLPLGSVLSLSNSSLERSLTYLIIKAAAPTV